ncbi:MAG: copper-translocating P-type ATPase [Dehalococcoidia bacterium]|nr:copper-translocating P-type ATPase [Dehalococcoidia bacterium]
MAEDFRRRFWISLVLTIPVVLLSPLIQDFLGIEEELDFPGDEWVQFAFASVIFFYGGWPFLTGIIGELRRREPGMMTLIALAISVAYVYSSVVVFGVSGEVFFWELATLIDVMLLGHWLEMRSLLGASGALEALARLLPAEAHRLLPDGSTEDVPVAQIGRGERVLVKPGERVPVDGVVVEGRTSLNEAMLTGESRPVEKGEGDTVIGGSINGESAVTVEVQKTGDETYLSQVTEMVRRAQASRSRTQDLANRAALWLVIIALGAGSATLVSWLVSGRSFEFALERTVTVMVIACPHALGLAVPLVVAVSTALAAGAGLLIRNRSAFERARSINAIVFDKTGTLTEGRFGVTDVVALNGRSEDEVLSLAAALESRSEHPIAAGVVEAARERGLDVAQPQEFRAIAGKGVEGTVNGRGVMVVSPGYLTERQLTVGDGRLRQIAEQGKTVVYLLVDGKVEGAVALADIVREESREAVDRLKGMGVQVMMLTGDSEPVARWVAGELGLTQYFAGVLPDKKADKIRGVKAQGLRVAMVGDGVNDAPALVEADVGIAIGAGADVAIESADIILVRSDPRDAVDVIELARATYSKMVQNLLWATGYNAVAIPAAGGVFFSLGFFLPPAAGAILMSLSTVIVAVNAQLLSRVGGRFRRAKEGAPPSGNAEAAPRHPSMHIHAGH